MPVSVSQARSAGWTVSSNCVEGLGGGIIATVDPTGITKHNALSLHYTSAGQIAGMSATIFGPVSPYAQSLYRSGPNNSSTITVWFRTPSASVCDGSVFAEPIGNTLVVAAPGGAVKLPTTITQALQMGYTSGAFIGGMGRHFARNLVGGGTFAYDALNFFPIVSMFDTVTGNATAVFFMSITRQQSLFPPSTNMWDIIALPNFLMCRNFCPSSDCPWTNHSTDMWSTMHVWFVDNGSISHEPTDC